MAIKGVYFEHKLQNIFHPQNNMYPVLPQGQMDSQWGSGWINHNEIRTCVFTLSELYSYYAYPMQNVMVDLKPV